MKDHMFKVRTERYVFMIDDDRSYTHNLSSCEFRALKKNYLEQ